MQALLEHFITQSTLYSLIAVLLVAFLESLALVVLIRHPLMPVYIDILRKVVGY